MNVRAITALLLLSTSAWSPDLVAGQAIAVPPPALPVPRPTTGAAAAAADRLIAVTGIAAQFDKMAPKIVDMMMPSIVPGNTGREGELRRILSEEFVTSFARLGPLMVAKARELYASKFTAEELNSLADFYETPLGKKSLSSTTEIQLEMFAYGQQAGRAAAQDAMPRILERMRRANFKLPQGV